MDVRFPEKGPIVEDRGIVQGSVCAHHWIIDSPIGPMSRGICQFCREVREFKNYLENSYWDDGDVSLDQVSSGSRYPASIPSLDERDPEENS